MTKKLNLEQDIINAQLGCFDFILKATFKLALAGSILYYSCSNGCSHSESRTSQKNYFNYTSISK